jgi:hypothetical protein
MSSLESRKASVIEGRMEFRIEERSNLLDAYMDSGCPKEKTKLTIQLECLDIDDNADRLVLNKLEGRG